MNDTVATTAPAWPRKLVKIGGVLLVAGLLLTVLAGPFNRLGVTSFFVPLLALLVGVLLLVLGLLATAIGYYSASARGLAFDKGRTALLAVAGAIAAGYVGYVIAGSRGLPPIHEISTDLDSPPMFVDVVARRAATAARNPAEYVAELKNPQTGAVMNVPDLQRQAYPDIQPLVLTANTAQAFALAERAVDELGWEKVAAVPGEGRIEATDTTLFFGFKDDIVIRVRAEGAGARVDVRSKSRVGLGDAGANAKRVRALLAKLRS